MTTTQTASFKLTLRYDKNTTTLSLLDELIEKLREQGDPKHLPQETAIEATFQLTAANEFVLGYTYHELESELEQELTALGIHPSDIKIERLP